MPSDDFWSDLPGRAKRSAKVKVRAMRVVDQEEPHEESMTQPALAEPNQLSLATLVAGCLLALVGTAAGFGLVGWQLLQLPVDPTNQEPQIVTIARGDRSMTIAQTLEADGLVPSRWPVLAYLTLTQRTIRAGTYSLSPAMTGRAIARTLASGAIASHDVTIPEGWRLEQIADLLDKTGVVRKTDFLKAATYDPVRYTLPSGITLEPGTSLEGLLFPDTYRIAYGTTSKDVVTTMLANYTKRTAALQPTYAQLILASIIEREAKTDAERPQIAGVYQNRLKANLKLQADPTVQYAKDRLGAAGTSLKWWAPISAVDYQTTKSAYNTYLNFGLPPTPIANPGIKSLTAAVHPADHSYYYFFHTQAGTTIYSKTIDEHNQAKKKYGVSSVPLPS